MSICVYISLLFSIYSYIYIYVCGCVYFVFPGSASGRKPPRKGFINTCWTCDTLISRKELVKSSKSQTFVLHIICDDCQSILRQIQSKFGVQLIRGVPNLKNAKVTVNKIIPRKTQSTNYSIFPCRAWVPTCSRFAAK